MKRIHTILLFLTTIFCLQSQNMVVESFELLPHDLTANIEGTQRFDQNTRKNAALIKIETTAKGLHFDGGMIGLVGDPLPKIGEVWVYVPEGAKKITIQHAELGTLRDYYYPTPIQSGKTYLMKLKTGKVITHVEQDYGGDYLTLIVEPKNSELLIDGKTMSVDAEGGVSTFLTYGDHQYEVSANMYKREVGNITISGGAVKKNITLAPDYSILQINTNPQGATVYIDDVNSGTTPLKTSPIKSGEHILRFTLPMYTPKTITHTVIGSGATQTITETLQPDFSTVTITAPEQAEIYINNEKKGSGKWEGKLLSGTYLLEARKPSHRPYKTTVTVERGKTQTIAMQAPTPQYGAINIQSTPTNAMVYVDGKEIGTTPGIFKNILIGKREVTIKKVGYSPVINKVTVEEGKLKEVTATLPSGKDVKFIANKAGASLYIDGNYIGSANGTYPVSYGTHKVEYHASGTKYYETTLNVSQTKDTQVVEDNTHNAHKYVDLGLSVKWATCNVGANTPEEYGNYFAWGETTTKSSYSNTNYKYSSNPSTLPLSADVAHVNWGGNWRMPTKAEQDELRNSSNCTWTWTTQNGVKGYKVTSKKNGNSIFLPAAGYCKSGSLSGAGYYSLFWSSSRYTSGGYYAYDLYFSSSDVDWSSNERYYGLPVRAVCE